MLDRSLVLAIVTSLLTLQPVGPAWAGHGYFEDRVAGGGPAETAREFEHARPLPADPGPTSQIGWQTSGAPRPPQGRPLPVSSSDYSRMRAWSGETSQAPWPECLIRLPRVEPHLTDAPSQSGRRFPPGQLADGTWREDGRYIIINLGGQQVRLVKESPAQSPQGIPHQTDGCGAVVYGRLLNHGRPLANCQVMIRPMTKNFLGYRFNTAVQPLRTTTDVQGVYRFENIPPGLYKLSWLPEGTNQWIRRIASRPDLTVRQQETTQVKDIPVALRTIN
jgi:hypothetical protein